MFLRHNFLLRGIVAASLRRATLTRLLHSPPKNFQIGVRMISFSCSTPSPCIGGASAPQDENVKSTMLISCRECIDVSRGKKLELKCTKLPPKDFCSFIENNLKAEIVVFLREIAKEVECNRQIWDFHMRIMDCDGGFKVKIYYGVEKSGPAVLPSSHCISCSPNALLFPGQDPSIEARQCVLQELSDHPYAVCRLDAKGRCGFIITPVRHVHRMSELDDEELFGLWSLAVRALREANLPFTSMILNHGSYRNLEHLHLKVWVDKDLHEQYRAHWSSERQALWQRLQELASERHRKRAHLKKM